MASTPETAVQTAEAAGYSDWLAAEEAAAGYNATCIAPMFSVLILRPSILVGDDVRRFHFHVFFEKSEPPYVGSYGAKAQGEHEVELQLA